MHMQCINNTTIGGTMHICIKVKYSHISHSIAPSESVCLKFFEPYTACAQCFVFVRLFFIIIIPFFSLSLCVDGFLSSNFVLFSFRYARCIYFDWYLEPFIVIGLLLLRILLYLCVVLSLSFSYKYISKPQIPYELLLCFHIVDTFSNWIEMDVFVNVCVFGQSKWNGMEWNKSKIPKCIFSPKTFENERKSIVFGQQFGMEFGSFQVLEKVSVSTVNSFDFSRYFSLSIALCNCNAMWYRILCVVRSTILLAVFFLLILESATGRCGRCSYYQKKKRTNKMLHLTQWSYFEALSRLLHNNRNDNIGIKRYLCSLHHIAAHNAVNM